MPAAERLARDSAHSFREDDDEYRIPSETFEISDPSFENGVPQRYRGTFWSRWLGVAILPRRKEHLQADEEEGDRLLYGTDVSGAEIVRGRTQRPCIHWCIYGGNTALSIS
jgi:hypothetical protein